MIKSASEAAVIMNNEYSSQVPSATPNLKTAYTLSEALPQCTLKKSAGITGKDSTHQKEARIVLHPAPPSTGIVFRRVDLNPTIEIKASAEVLEATADQMNLRQGHVRIKNISHLMSAFSGLGIDNAYVDIDGDEIPYLDSSADTFSFLIQAIGSQTQPFKLKRFIRIKEKLHIAEHTSWITLMPFEGCKIEHQTPDHSTCQIMLSRRMYLKALSRARHEVLTAHDKILRDVNEVQRHYMLDLVGDLYILGANLIGAIQCYQPNHLLNQKLIHVLLKKADIWEYTEFHDSTQVPKNYQYPYLQPAYTRLTKRG
jgi:UDP-3-O-[3-hydroxymyristoyl] N-acetylglucosamine deacetylase